MPLYTFKCPECKDITEVLQGMNASFPICKKCSKCKCNREDGTCGCGKSKQVMDRIFKPNARPQSTDGSWGFGKEKKG